MKLLREAYSKNKNSVNAVKEDDVLDELTAEIQKEEDAEAERQLSRSLEKNDFLEMKVIGQFNKVGFGLKFQRKCSVCRDSSFVDYDPISSSSTNMPVMKNTTLKNFRRVQK